MGEEEAVFTALLSPSKTLFEFCFDVLTSVGAGTYGGSKGALWIALFFITWG